MLLLFQLVVNHKSRIFIEGGHLGICGGIWIDNEQLVLNYIFQLVVYSFQVVEESLTLSLFAFQIYKV